jgi:hypothetical protein
MREQQVYVHMGPGRRAFAGTFKDGDRRRDMG